MISRRFQAAAARTGGNSSPVMPSSWDPTKNIFIQNRLLARYDHIAAPYWDPFVEYCENTNSLLTDQQLRDKCMNVGTASLSKIGITRLKDDPLDPSNPDLFSYNSDFSDSSVQWTSGNDAFNIYSFYYLTDYDTNMTTSEKEEANFLRLYYLRKAIEEANPYTIGTQDEDITNRNMRQFYGTKIKGNGLSTLNLFTIGTDKTLTNIQETRNRDFWGDPVNQYRCFDFDWFMTSGYSQPFYNRRTDWADFYIEPNISTANNYAIPQAAVLGIIRNGTMKQISNDEKIQFTVMFILTLKTLNERDLLI